MPRAVALIRVSTKEQKADLQLKDIREYCSARGIELVKVFKEEASAWKSAERPVFDSMLVYVRNNGIDLILVWNMDRFSRQPEEKVLALVRSLSLEGIEVAAVHGDAWADLVSMVQNIRKMDALIGPPMAHLIESVVRGMECRRANRESQTKSERVKAAVKVVGGVTRGSNGKKWGRKSLPKQTKTKIIELYESGISQRGISRTVKYYQDDKERYVSLGSVHKTLVEYHKKKLGILRGS